LCGCYDFEARIHVKPLEAPKVYQRWQMVVNFGDDFNAFYWNKHELYLGGHMCKIDIFT
jgi:hypothetical protein